MEPALSTSRVQMQVHDREPTIPRQAKRDNGSRGLRGCPHVRPGLMTRRKRPSISDRNPARITTKT